MSVQDKPFDSTQDLPAKPHSNSASATFIERVAASAVTPEVVPEFQGPQEIGKYQLREEIGRGGMGVVYSALDTDLNRTVALKVLPVASQLDPECQKRFRNESRAAAQLSHANIVPLYEVGDFQGISYYSMQYIPGQNLSVVVKQIRDELQSKYASGRSSRSGTAKQVAGTTIQDSPRRRSGSGARGNDSDESHSRSFAADSYALTGRSQQLTSTLSLCRSVAELGAEVASGLQHAHEQSIVHRDMKPSNLILDSNGKVWITDFGLAQIRNAPAITQTGVLLGTLRYMSPEQASGHRAFVDHRTDIYSLGVTLYELLTLKRAFDGRRTEDILRQIAFERPAAIRSLNASVPMDLQTIVEKAMAHAPHDRYETAQDLANDLMRFVRGEPISARRPTVTQKVRFWGTRHPKAVTGIFGTAAAILMTSVAAAGIFFVAFENEQQQKELVERKLDESEGLRLAANSVLEVNEDPRLAMELAALSTERFPSLEARQAWLRASDANHEYASVITDKSEFGGLAMSPDGRRVLAFASPEASAEVARKAVIYEMETGRPLLTLDNEVGISTAAISPRGALIVTSASPGIRNAARNVNPHAAAAVLWNGANGQKLHTFAGTSVHRAHSGLFDQTGRRIVLPQKADAVVYDTDRLQPELTLRGHAEEILDASFSSDGSLILTVGRDFTVRVWDGQSGAPLEEFAFEGEWQPWHTAAFNRNQSAVIMATQTGDFLFPLDGNPGTSQPLQIEEQRRMRVGVNQALVAAFWLAGNEVSIIDDQTLAEISTLQVPERIESVEFLSQQAGVLVRCDRRFYVFDAYSGQQLQEFRGHTQSILDIAATPDGNRICTIGSDDTLRFWNVRSGRDQRTFASSRDEWVPQRIAISQRGEKVAIASVKETSTQIFRHDGVQLPGQLQGMLLSSYPRSEMPVTVQKSVVTVWDPQTSRIVARRHFPCQQVEQVEVSADSKKLYVIPDTGRAFTWSLPDDRISRLPDIEGGIRNVDMTADKGHLLLGCSSGQVVILDTSTDTIVHSHTHPSGVLDVEFAADGKRFLSVDRNGNTIVRVLGAEAPLCEFKSEPRTSLKGRFTSNGDLVVVTGILKGDPIDVWDAETGEHLRSLGKALSMAPQNVVVDPVQPLVAIRDRSTSTQLINALDGNVTTLQDGGANLLAFMDDTLVTVSWSGSLPREKAHELSDAAKPAASSHPGEIKVWNLETLELQSATPISGAPQWLDVDSQTRNIFLVTHAWRASIFDAAATTMQSRTPGHSSEIVYAGFTSQDRYLITMSLDGEVQVLNAEGDQLVRRIQHDAFLHSGSLSPDGELLAGGDDVGNVVLWKVSTGERVRLQKLHDGPVRRLTFDGGGHRTLSWGDAQEVTVWDLRADQHRAWPTEGDVRHAEFSADGQHLLLLSSQELANPDLPQPVNHDQVRQSAGTANRAVLVNLDSEARTLLPQQDGSIDGHFHPLNDSVVLLSATGALQRHDLKNSAPPQPISVAELTPTWFQFSPNGSVMVLAQPNLVSVWDVATNTELVRDGYENPLVTEPYFEFDPLNRFAIVNGKTCLKMPWAPLTGRRTPRPLTEIEKSRLRLDLSRRE